MFKSRNLKFLWFFVFLALFLTVQSAAATTMSFTVNVGAEVTRNLNLTIDDHVLIEFTAVSQENDGVLDFWITYPNGTVQTSYHNVGNVNYDFICNVEGDYVLHFANVGSSYDVFVSMNYEVEHNVMGISQPLFEAIAIIVICVLAVAAFVLLGKRY